jgi:hypothetical protein
MRTREVRRITKLDDIWYRVFYTATTDRIVVDADIDVKADDEMGAYLGFIKLAAAMDARRERS